MQGTAERRVEIMKKLCRRRKDTIGNLAHELGVSERTVRRDLEALSLSEPIYTQSGRYGGGVYVDEGYSLSRMYMTEEELNVLHKLADFADKQGPCTLSEEEKKQLRAMIAVYTKPKINRKGV